MKSVDSIGIDSSKIISREKLIKLKGGEAGTGQWMACSCDGGVNPPFSGTWEKCYDLSDETMTNDINQMCVSGGTCNNQNLWCVVSGA
jgi:hypothetical protein